MLLSMTGYGEARCQSDALSLSIELRALNNRYLKVSLRAPDPYHLLEAEFEKLIRRTVGGTHPESAAAEIARPRMPTSASIPSL